MDDTELNKILYQAFFLGQRALLLTLSITGRQKYRIQDECMQLILDVARGNATLREGGQDILSKITPAFLEAAGDPLKEYVAKGVSEDIKRDQDLAKQIVAGSGLPPEYTRGITE
jgi:hypothetical protein